MAWQDKTLAEKLAAIQRDIDPVEVLATSSDDDAYEYLPADRVMDAVRRQLRLKGVVMLPSPAEFDPSSRRVHMAVTFINAHSPLDTLSGSWWGEPDSGSKRPAAASQTNALKGFLVATFQIRAVPQKVDEDDEDARTKARQQQVLQRRDAEKQLRRATAA